MDRSDRLHLVGRISYYVGWIALLCGGVLQVNIGKAFFTSIDLTKRNLFELSIASFVICMASEVRALATSEKELPVAVKRQAAA
jgi:hypothetical protein